MHQLHILLRDYLVKKLLMGLKTIKNGKAWKVDDLRIFKTFVLNDFNSSLSTSHFPNDLQKAEVVPAY